MSNAVFPVLPGLSWGRTLTPVWKTDVKESVSGMEFRWSAMAYPRYRVGLKYEVLRADSAAAELQVLVGFFNARRGAWDDGSSPRARGTLFDANWEPTAERFIPASAGNTPAISVSSLARSVHPRERGEHPVKPAKRRNPGGSSPRARGTPATLAGAACRRRFIPASAGNTISSLRRLGGDAVHPRERREHCSE